MAKLQHCGHCGRWFRPDPRNAGRQKVCGDPVCQGKRHQKACKDWRRRNPFYDKEDRLVQALVKDSPPVGAEAVEVIDWKVAMELVGPEVAVLVKECGKAICQRSGAIGRDGPPQLPFPRRETPSARKLLQLNNVPTELPPSWRETPGVRS
jgi:hypothetical protein